MKVFVTGVAGFLGSHLAERLIREGHEVIVTDNLIGGERSNAPLHAEVYRLDCCNLEEMEVIHSWHHGIELVFHCACCPHEGLSVFSPVTVTNSVFQATVTVATAAIKAGVKRFVNCSSMARYGKQPILPFVEDMIPFPQDPYAIAKIAAENALNALGRHHGMEVVHAVPHSIFGPRQRHYDPFRNVVAIFMNLMLSGRQPFIYGSGEQERCFTYIADAIDPLVKCGFLPDLDGEIINIGPDEDFVTINDLAARIARILNFDLKPVYLPDRPCEVKQAYCSADKSRRLLGYKTTYTLDQGLKEMAEWMKKVGPKPFVYSLPIEIPDGKGIPETWKSRLF